MTKIIINALTLFLNKLNNKQDRQALLKARLTTARGPCLWIQA